MTLDELTTPVTVDEARTAIYDVLAAVGINTTSWLTGSVVRAVTTAMAVVVAALSGLIAVIARGAFLALAASDWLTLKAHYDYGVDRIEATTASGIATFDNAGGGVYSGGFGDLVATDAATGKQYRSTVAWSIGAAQTGAPIALEALEPGSASTLLPGATLTTNLSASVTGTNAAAFVGTDAETDPALQTRARESTGALSPDGPQDAYAFAAKSAVRLDGTPIGITQVAVVAAGGAIDVYVGTASGIVSGTQGDPATDLGAVHAALQQNAVPLGTPETTHSASVVDINVTYEAWVTKRNRTNADIQTIIEAALVQHFIGEPIHGRDVDPMTGDGLVYVEGIRAAIFAALPGEVYNVVVTIPASDLTLAAGELPRAGTITCTAVHQS